MPVKPSVIAMGDSLFARLGRQLGRAAAPKLRQARWGWQTLTGSDEDRIRAERAWGRELAARLREKIPSVAESPETPRVASLTARLAEYVRDQRLVFTAEAIPLPEPSAFALPGGFVFLTQPLIALCDSSDDELAFVLGHEMAHVIRGHVAERFVEESAVRLVSGLLRRVGPLGRLAGELGYPLLASAHSQDQEFDADQLGARLARAAGFDPLAGARLLDRLSRLHGPTPFPGEYFSSHPPTAERVHRLRTFVGRA